jgi:non-specific serine/threonine protein kinase/serine/threonine-protein kinase
MTTGDFARLEALFSEMVDLLPEERARALQQCCANRSDLREELAALLTAHDRLRSGDSAGSTSGAAPDVGDQLGAFRLVERVSDGGMGTIFRAERADGEFTSVAAVKVIRGTLITAELRQRFTIERQILASLKHPNIVTLLDGGTTPGGHGYLVMEFVDGVPIDQYCRDRSLALEERLGLFRQLCDAVHYAHQHGVVHRDLKPGNIFVDTDGRLKVLDFGVAKVLHADPADAPTRESVAGPLTPNYASPEQVRGSTVTSASDVYSLGVLLYELVADARPYDAATQPLDRVVDLVVLTDPPRPSVASGRAHLRGDIDAMVMKALRKAPGERYSSAAEFGADVGRYLAREPVLARAPSAGYVLRRLAVRHKPLVVVAAAGLAGVIAAAGVAVWGWRTARREQVRAETRFSDTRELANALIFKIHDAVAPLAGSTPVRRTIVDSALSYLERLERDAGAGDETLRLELAAAYRQIAGILGGPQAANLGDRDGALRQYERARSILHPMVAAGTGRYEAVREFTRVSGSLATILGLRGESAKAQAITKEGVDAASAYRARHPDERRALQTLAAATFEVAWNAPAAERAARWRETLAHYDQLLAEEPDSAESQRNVALAEKYLADLLPVDEAEAHWRRAVELDERRLTATPANRQAQFDTAISIAGLARVSEMRGKDAEALALLQRSVGIRRSLSDSDPADVLARDRLGGMLTNLARVQLTGGDIVSARRSAEESVRLLESLGSVAGESRVRLAYAWFELALAEKASGRTGPACRAFRNAADGLANKPGYAQQLTTAVAELRRCTP